jgi:hypothetical protein
VQYNLYNKKILNVFPLPYTCALVQVLYPLNLCPPVLSIAAISCATDVGAPVTQKVLPL